MTVRIPDFWRYKYIFTTHLSNNGDVLESLKEVLHQRGIITVETREEEEVLQQTQQEKAEWLMKAINEAISGSPDTLASVLVEMNKFDGLRDIIDSMKKRILEEEGIVRRIYSALL